MNKSESIVKLSAALAKFQAEVKNPPNSANNPFFKSKYAPLDVVINTAKELLGKYGISYIQMPGGDGDKVTCTTVLMCEGEWIESDLLVLKADKVTAQGAGSAITYARRYQLTAMLGLAGEEDDDGNLATGNKHEPKSEQKQQPKANSDSKEVISEAQKKRLFAITGKDHAVMAKEIMLKYGYESSKDILKKDYEKICNEIEGLLKGDAK